MPVIHVFPNADGMLKDKDQSKIKVIPNNSAISIGVLKGGMTSGRDSVSLLFEQPDGTILFAETSAAAFFAATNALYGRLMSEGRDPNAF